MFGGFDDNINDHSGFSWAMDGLNAGFEETYHCRAGAGLPDRVRQIVEFGGKILMPPSALETLSRLNISYPMMFKITNDVTGSSTHCGVLEFSSPEGVAYIPRWMIETLQLSDGALIRLTNVSLPLGSFVKLQPQSSDFLDISDPKAVYTIPYSLSIYSMFSLERSLRQFASMTPGDLLSIHYNDKIYKLLVIETKPSSSGISVVETDLQVDFAPPPDYKEPIPIKHREEKAIANSLEASGYISQPSSLSSSFQPFKGSANRLSSKPISTSDAESSAPSTTEQPPNALSLPSNTLYFGAHSDPKQTPIAKDNQPQQPTWKAFSGASNKLK